MCMYLAFHAIHYAMYGSQGLGSYLSFQLLITSELHASMWLTHNISFLRCLCWVGYRDCRPITKPVFTRTAQRPVRSSAQRPRHAEDENCSERRNHHPLPVRVGQIHRLLGLFFCIASLNVQPLKSSSVPVAVLESTFVFPVWDTGNLWQNWSCILSDDSI